MLAIEQCQYLFLVKMKLLTGLLKELLHFIGLLGLYSLTLRQVDSSRALESHYIRSQISCQLIILREFLERVGRWKKHMTTLVCPYNSEYAS